MALPQTPPKAWKHTIETSHAEMYPKKPCSEFSLSARLFSAALRYNSFSGSPAALSELCKQPLTNNPDHSVVKRGRGRPQGSKDTKPRKRKEPSDDETAIQEKPKSRRGRPVGVKDSKPRRYKHTPADSRVVNSPQQYFDLLASELKWPHHPVIAGAPNWEALATKHCSTFDNVTSPDENTTWNTSGQPKPISSRTRQAFESFSKTHSFLLLHTFLHSVSFLCN